MGTPWQPGTGAAPARVACLDAGAEDAQPCTCERDIQEHGGAVTHLPVENLCKNGSLDAEAVAMLGRLYDAVIVPASMTEHADFISEMAGIAVLRREAVATR